MWPTLDGQDIRASRDHECEPIASHAITTGGDAFASSNRDWQQSRPAAITTSRNHYRPQWRPAVMATDDDVGTSSDVRTSHGPQHQEA
ncbi:hypothetical protein ACFYO1_09230 [Nocardia sp. NPDC006044]|uniref:hypothetical protein n=1 Tax=Nocardia sp. NPDC006044 TaxID=3364306 RepID=UPI00368F81EA